MQLPNIELSRLHPHPNNPRGSLGDLTELAESIKTRGIQQNLTVVPADMELYQRKITGKKAYTGDYTVVIGHRRSAAAKMAGLTEVPCLIATDMDVKDQLAVMLSENMQRKELTLLEEAQGIQLMLDWGDSIKEVSEKTGLSETTVRRRVKIVKTFGKEAIERVQDRPIDLADYEKVYKVENPEKQAEVFDVIGTREFDWALKAALDAQEKEGRKMQLARIIAGFATEATPEEYHKSLKAQYWNYYRYDQGDLEAVQNLASEAEKPDGELAGNELFYTVEQGFSGITIYTKRDEPASNSEAEERKAQEQAEKEAHISRIKGMFKQAYEMRLTFAKKFNATAETSEAVNKMATIALFSTMHSSEDTIRAMFGIDKKFRQSWDKGDGETRDEAINRILDSHHDTKTSGTFIFKGAYSRMEPGNVSCLDNIGKYKPSESLTLIYDYLKAIGYTTSEQEEMLIDGTHSIYTENA